MPGESRWNQVQVGMHFDQVKALFGNDMWESGPNGFTWMVNNEADTNPDHGYMITFDESRKVKDKGTFSCA